MHRAPTGEQLLEVPLDDADQVKVAFAGDGLRVEASVYPDTERFLVDASGSRGPTEELTSPILVARGFAPSHAPAGYRIRRGRLSSWLQVRSGR